MAEFIYQMIKARKAYGDRVILDDVTLSFLPGAKIGVVGPNGMGKSTLLKIMAGLDTVSNGEAYLTPGFTVGILQQEPPLDDTKTVGENIGLSVLVILLSCVLCPSWLLQTGICAFVIPPCFIAVEVSKQMLPHIFVFVPD